MVTPNCFSQTPLALSHLFPAAFSQSCLSSPSWGVINSGAKAITRLLPGLRITGVNTL